MSAMHVPVPNSLLPFWRTEPHPLDNHRSTESLPEHCDIVIIGAGYAGASVAYHLLNQSKPDSPPLSITILEAREACSGATARNGGHLKPDLFNHIATVAAEYGVDAAAEIAAFEADHVQAIKDLVEQENIDCDYIVTKAMDVQLNEGHFQKLKDGHERLVAGGCSPSTRVQTITPGEAETVSRVKDAVGCFVYEAGHIWAYKLVLHLLKRSVERGVNLQTQTPVTKIAKSTDPTHRWRVDTSRGAMAAKVVVLATNAYTSAIAPQYQDKIIPVRGTCVRIAVRTGCTASRLTHTYILRRNGWDYDYLIPRDDGSIVVGGARSAFIQDEKNWYNVSDDSQVLEPAVRYFDHYMQRNFLGWENSQAYTDRAWTGIMGYSTDGLPHLGQVPGQDGQYILAGFTGHGMPQVFLAAKGIARMVVEGVEYEATGLPRLFQTNACRVASRRNNILENTPRDRASETQV
ncbi:hypothetical protein N7492_005459 [Penicillium capsulatum]|uniref:FAD dependent oxidoreductase domain-containing protein n=1 Tax=Penicillium capsulatum TaxID=69766 RepID=A0A9W9I9T9_9EURO|nr:hypothetical protein N7492_005459 [Penicillium capsulatum]KAJ6135440.1 hypothetical protein N7512_000600 [Penicillium capsulatum]